MRVFLCMPPFWDALCPPLGITSLQAYLKKRDHQVSIYDFNTDTTILKCYQKYFQLLVDVVPAAKELNIMRNGPDYFSRHQMAWLFLRNDHVKYQELTSLILNVDGCQELEPGEFYRFDTLFQEIYDHIKELAVQNIKEFSPELFGCTLLSSTFPAALYILLLVKEIDPSILTVLGGPGAFIGAHADSPDTKRILEKCDWIDNILIGEGEVLLENLINGKYPKRKIISIKDIDYQLLNMDSLPTPDYTGLDYIKYFNLSVTGSRGCPYKCSFCYETNYWKKYRKRSVENIINDIKKLRTSYNKKDFYLCDSLGNFISKELASMIKQESLPIHWDTYMRADKELLDPDYIRLLAKGGLRRVRLGMESGSDEILKLMDKKVTAEQMGEVLKVLSSFGIRTSTLWIIGYPGEDEEHFQETLDFLTNYHEYIYAADPWQFIFHPTGLVSSESFESEYGMYQLYPDEFTDTLLVKYYELKNVAGLKEKFKRISRVDLHLKKLGVPNPYSIMELSLANRRWKELHEN